MVKKTEDKIFELTIEDNDEVSGVDSISLVDDPAIEINWVAFKRVTENFHIPEGEDDRYLEKLYPFGQDESELLNEGFEVDEVIYPHQENFIYANPNEPSELDDEFFRIRYKYVKNPQADGPAIKHSTRSFCKQLINRNLVFRIEDMLDQQNDQGQSFADWRGGYNCRHIFAKIVYKKKGTIGKKGGVKEGYDILGDPQNDTRTNNPSFSKVQENVFGKAEPIQINGVGVFEHGEDMHNYADLETGVQATYLTDKGKKYAEDMGKWVFDNGKDKLIHSGIKRAEDTANIAADKANELHGKDKVKTEPNPLLKTLDIGNYTGKKLGSFVEEYWLKNKDKKIPGGETFQNFIDRMEKCYKFVEGAGMNHQVISHSKVIRALKAIHDNKGVWDDKTSQAFLDSRKEADFDYNVGTIGGYVDPGIGKKKKKKLTDKQKPLVPSIPEIAGPAMTDFDYLKPQKHSKQAFATDEEKQIVLGPAMVPDMKIFRKDPSGNPYYVYFSAETIFQISQKYLKNKYIDNNDMMHDGEAVPDVFVIESWIKESDNDKSTDYGFKSLPVGTWFVSMKINNPDIWNKIKSHQLNGFSVSGYFAEEPANFMSNEELFLYAVADILKEK